MAKILGLDLGTNSIGWAVVEKTDNNTILKDKGVIIFTEGVKKEKGNEKSRAAERTGYRSARRLKFRRKIRKYKTLLVLAKNKMCPLTVEEVEAWRQSNFKKYPNKPAFLEWLQTKENENINPYYFRDKASREKVTKLELGRAFYHIAQRRGFLSNKLEQTDDNIIEEYNDRIKEVIENSKNEKELLEAINQTFEVFEFENKKEKDLDITEKKLNKTRKYILNVIKNKVKNKTFSSFNDQKKAIVDYINKPENLGPVKGEIKTLSSKIEEGETLGQYFWKLYQKNRHYEENKIRNRYTAREEHYLKEFEIICKTQNLEGINENEKDAQKRYSGIVKDLYKAIFYQRSLKSQKGLVGNCPFEKDKPRCQLSHPLFEEFRMWSFINNIKIKTPDDEKMRTLTKEEKEKIIPKFYRKSKSVFDFSEIVEALIPKGEIAKYYKDKEPKNANYIVNYKLKTSVNGCPTSTSLKSILGDEWKNSIYKEIKDKEDKAVSTIYKYEIAWHALSTFTSEEKLIEFAKNRLGVNEAKAIKFSKISLKKGYASLSLNAIKKILPYLEKGLIYSHAVFMANLDKVVDENIWKNEQKRDELEDKIKQIIEQHTLNNQISQVVNNLIGNCKDNNSTYNEESKEVYKTKVKEALENYFGKNNWQKNKDKNKILKDTIDLFFEQLKKNLGKREFLRIKRLDDEIIDFLLGENETGEVYCTNKTRIDKIYHPSDIKRFKPVIIKNKAGEEFTGLGSPATPSVRNPMAMRSLFILRKLINTLIVEEKIDKNTKIHIELARELNDANKRKAIYQWQTERKKLHDDYKEKIKELYSKETKKEITPSETDILKYELWEEQNHICLYTGKTIGITDFLNKNPKYDIEHTIPRSRSYDNSRMNKTLCDVEYNRKDEYKNTKIPFELGEEKQNEILKRIAHWKRKYEKLDDEIANLIKKTKHPKYANKEQKDKLIQKRHYLTLHRDYWKGKYERFTMEDVPQGFKNSQKIDIGIISKYAREYLSSVFKNKNGNSNVYAVNGEMTAVFRKAWGLQESFINDLGNKDYKPKNRHNHIHHCIDAITIACMDKKKYDLMAEAWKAGEKADIKEAKRLLAESKPWKTFTQDVKNIDKEVLVVHYTPDNLKKQTKKKLRKRGKIQYRLVENLPNTFINKKEGKDYFIVSKNGKTKYKIPIYQQGDTVRGSLHRETFYGAIKQKIKDDKGKIVRDENIIYVIRKPLEFGEKGFKDKDSLKKIIDPIVREIVMNRVNEKGLKKAFSDGIKMMKPKRENKKIKRDDDNKIIFEKDKNGNFITGPIIKKVRIRTSIKDPIHLKQQRDKSEHKRKPYKEYFYVENDENYCMAIYEKKESNGKIKRAYELVSVLDAGKYYKLSNKNERIKHPLIDEKHPVTGYPLKYSNNKPVILKKGQMILRKIKKESIDDILALPFNEQLSRLFIIEGIDKDGIKVRFHNEARAGKELVKFMKGIITQQNLMDNKLDKEGKPKESKITGPVGGIEIGNHKNFPYQKFKPSNFDAFIANIDFKISPIGEISKI